MQKLGWYLMAFCMLAGACGKNERNEVAATAGAAGASAGQGGSGGTGGSAGSAPRIELEVGGGGTGAAPSGGRPPVDLSGVQMPLIRCGVLAAGGAADDADDAAGGATGGAEAETSAGGASWDDACSPPPSTCLGDLTLVYFDAGECIDGFCEWQKQSLDCRNSCYEGGCQDSITTK